MHLCSRTVILPLVVVLHLSVQSGCIEDFIPDRPDINLPGDVLIPDTTPFDLGPADISSDGETCRRNCYDRVCGPDECGGTCGTCPQGTVCSLDYSICLVTDVLQPAGTVCGQDDWCQPVLENPYYPGTYYSNPDWPRCMDHQCSGLLCERGLCSAPCVVRLDEVVNGSGVAGADWIDDDASVSMCPPFTGQGWQGASICVGRETGADGSVIGVCVPAASMTPCNPGGNCPQGEQCGYLRTGTSLERRCMAVIESGAGTGESCGYEPVSGTNTICRSGMCTEQGCTVPCDSDSDCALSGSVCREGLCEGTGRSCAGDYDCSPLVCGNQVVVDGITARGCVPRTCAADRDCPGVSHYCLPGIAVHSDGTYLPSGLCRPVTEGGATVGEFCGRDAGGGLRVCRNTELCADGVCTAMCNDDLDCFVHGPYRCAWRSEVFLASYLQVPTWLVTGYCMRTGYGPTGCDGDDDCGGSACSPWVGRDAAGSIEVLTGCVEPMPESWPLGARCGELASGAVCASGYCFGQDIDSGKAGWCSHLCSVDSDCPDFAYVGSDGFRWICGSMPVIGGESPSLDDNMYASWCIPVSPDSSLQDCSVERRCQETGQICTPVLRAGPPASGDRVDYLCLAAKSGLPAGSLCDPAGDGSDCETGLCAPSATSQAGFCTYVCGVDAQCEPFGSEVSCSPVVIGQARDGTRLTADMCRMTGDCVVCRDDSDCGPDHRCANITGSWWYRDDRCVRVCSDDSGCVDSPGTVCEEVSSIMSVSGDAFSACMRPVCG